MSTQRHEAAVGSSTQTETTETPPETTQLRLVGENSGRHVQWTEDTVDNEHMNLKSSKICCIYHPVKEFGESSDESDDYSSSSESDSDSDADSHDCGHHHNHRHPRRVNAYERKPKLRN